MIIRQFVDKSKKIRVKILSYLNGWRFPLIPNIFGFLFRSFRIFFLKQNWVMTLMYDFFSFPPPYGKLRRFCGVATFLIEGQIVKLSGIFSWHKTGIWIFRCHWVRFLSFTNFGSPIMSALVGIWLPSSAVSRCNGKNLITFSSSIMQNCLDPLMLLCTTKNSYKIAKEKNQ